MVKVSVIMPVYDEKKYLLDSIRSILNQTFRDFEFIIIADRSELPVRELVDSFRDGRIKLWINEERKGITVSLNQGLAVAAGEYIARQDSDDMSERTRLFTQVGYLDNHPEVGVVGSSCTIIDEMDEVIDEWEAMPDLTNSLSSRNKMTHGSVMFRRSVIEDVGGYDERFKYAQDYDLWLRVSKKYQIRNLPARLYQSRIHRNMVGQQKAEAQALCVILAQRRAVGAENLKTVKYEDLTRKEKIKFHNMVVYNYLQGGDVVRATKEIDKLLGIDPLNLENIVMSISLFFGGVEGVRGALNTYRKIRAFINGMRRR